MTNKEFNLSEFQILLRMLSGAKVLEPTGNYVTMVNGKDGKVYCTTFMTRKCKDIEMSMLAADIQLLGELIPAKNKLEFNEVVKLYKAHKYEEVWERLVGTVSTKKGVKVVKSGLVRNRFKDMYLDNNDKKKNQQTDITTLELLGVSEKCIELALDAKKVFYEEKKQSKQSKNATIEAIAKKHNPPKEVKAKTPKVDNVVVATSSRSEEGR